MSFSRFIRNVKFFLFAHEISPGENFLKNRKYISYTGSCEFFTPVKQVWVTASLFVSSGLFVVSIVSVLPQISTSPIFFFRTFGPFLGQYLQLVSLPPSNFSFFQTSSKIQVFVYLFGHFYFHSLIFWNGKIHTTKSPFLFVNKYLDWSSSRESGIRLYLNVLENFINLSIFLVTFIFTHWSFEMAKSTRPKVLFFLLINTWIGLLAGNQGFVCILMSLRILWISWLF